MCHCAPDAPCHGDVLIRQFAKHLAAPTGDMTVQVGVHHTPAEFVELAAQCRHPFEEIALDGSLVESIGFRISHAAAFIVSFVLGHRKRLPLGVVYRWTTQTNARLPVKFGSSRLVASSRSMLRCTRSARYRRSMRGPMEE